MEHIRDWEEATYYYNGDKVRYKGNIYICNISSGKKKESFKSFSAPPYSPFWKFLKQEKEDNITKIGGNHIGNISGDNVIVYGNNTGNISANSNKSVVVVFGDVIGSITAEQVVRFDNLNMEAVKTMILDKTGQTQVHHDEL